MTFKNSVRSVLYISNWHIFLFGAIVNVVDLWVINVSITAIQLCHLHLRTTRDNI